MILFVVSLLLHHHEALSQVLERNPNRPLLVLLLVHRLNLLEPLVQLRQREPIRLILPHLRPQLPQLLPKLLVTVNLQVVHPVRRIRRLRLKGRIFDRIRSIRLLQLQPILERLKRFRTQGRRRGPGRLDGVASVRGLPDVAEALSDDVEREGRLLPVAGRTGNAALVDLREGEGWRRRRRVRRGGAAAELGEVLADLVKGGGFGGARGGRRPGRRRRGRDRRRTAGRGLAEAGLDVGVELAGVVGVGVGVGGVVGGVEADEAVAVPVVVA